MAANLGATTYTAVTWTAGDTITEAKLDNMVANDQAYDSHAAQGLLLNNTYSFAGSNAAASVNLNIANVNASDQVSLGESGYHTKHMAGVYQAPQAYTPAGAATATLDLKTGNTHDITMPAGNITIAVSNEIAGEVFYVSILQDGTGSRTVTWFTTIKWAGGSAPTLTTTADKKDLFAFKTTGADTYDGFVVGQNI